MPVRSDLPVTKEATRRAREDVARRFGHLAELARQDTPPERIRDAWDALHAHAEALSGVTRDAQRRAVLYFSVYEDSAGNLLFPLVATHGSMWGVTHTEVIDRGLRRVRPLSRHGRVQRWLDALDAVRDVNRRVFVEVYTTFYFTRWLGRHPAAAEVVKPDVLALYNRVHDAIATGRPLDREARREIYYAIFVHEQDDIVHPGVMDAASASGSPALVQALKRVSPRFKYFPRGERLWFTDFTSVDQRNREGLRACDFALEVGPERVFETLRAY